MSNEGKGVRQTVTKRRLFIALLVSMLGITLWAWRYSHTAGALWSAYEGHPGFHVYAIDGELAFAFHSRDTPLSYTFKTFALIPKHVVRFQCLDEERPFGPEGRAVFASGISVSFSSIAAMLAAAITVTILISQRRNPRQGFPIASLPDDASRNATP